MKILSSILFVAFLLTSVPHAEASTSNEDFYLQLQAVGEYIEELLPVDTTPLSSEEMRNIISDGAGWIVASQEESGRFEYEYEPYKGSYTHGDNIVRQAGTLYVLAEVYRAQSEKDETMADAIEASTEYFAGLTKEVDGAGACIKTSQNSLNCQLGTTALALLGILSYVEADPDQRGRYNDTIEDYAGFLLAAQLSEGGFSKNYNFGSGFKEEESPFFNGETLLALVHYYQYEPEASVKTIIDNAFTYLEAKEYDSNLYLWIMAALKDMQALWPSAEYIQYAEGFTNWRVERSVRYRHTAHNLCAYAEGLASAYSVLKGNVSAETDYALNSELNYWLSKNTRLQVDATNPYSVVNTDTGLQLLKLPDGQQAHGGFLTGANELTQRIDFTQHCVSSYLQKFEDIDGRQL